MSTAAPTEQVRVVEDPFRDDLFAPLDLRTGPDHLANELAAIAKENPEFAPGVVDEEDEEPANEPVKPVVAPAANEPEVVEYGDGSSITIEHTSKGWKATLSTGDANPEIFYGKTKEEMYQNVMVGKINATRKIRELNKREKLGIQNAVPATATPTATPQPVVRSLTPDEVFELKTKLAADPDLALQNWFQKKTGMSLDQLVSLAGEGRQAREELDCEGVSKAFLQEHPEYYPINENYIAILAYLAKTKLGKSVIATTKEASGNEDSLVAELYHKGFWTVPNLEDALKELTEAGLLESEPDEEEATVPATTTSQPAAPATPAAPAATTPANPRIADTRRRPRASLGIRPSTASVQTKETDELSSVEEIDDLSDDQVNQLFADIRKQRAKSRR